MIDLLPISVIIPNYNSAPYIEECLNSILDKNFALPKEIIIVDDASTDNSIEIINRIKNNYPEIIRLIELKNNVGALEARLQGLNFATQELISCPDADDIMSVGALEEAFNVLGEHDMVIMDIYNINENGIRKKMIDLGLLTFPINGFEACKLTFNKWKIHEKGIFKREIFLKAYNSLQNKNFYNSDEMVTRNLIYYSNSINYCSKAKYFYREHSTQTTKKQQNNVLHHLRSNLELFKFLKNKKYFLEDNILLQYMNNQIIGKAFFLAKSNGLEPLDINQILTFLKNINCFDIKNNMLSCIKCNLLKLYFLKYNLFKLEIK